MEQMKTEMKEIKNELNDVKVKVTSMEKDIADIKTTLYDHSEKLEFFTFKLLKHDEEIFLLKRDKYDKR